jgi:hypothetical protein
MTPEPKEEHMKATLRKTAELGEVVVAAFDTAAHYSTNPREVARLATRSIAQILRPRRRQLTPPRWPSFMVGDLL